MERPIDIAMAAGRIAKNTVRAQWMMVCRDWQKKSAQRPLYVTLPGSDGVDISLLIEEGILPVLENNAISDDAAGLVVAIERDLPAAGHLKERFPGLKVVPSDIFHELKAQRVVTDLSKEVRTFARGLIINLDFNQAFTVSGDSHPTVDLIGRLADVHKEATTQNWTLLLTHNTDLSGWPSTIGVRNARTLSEAMVAHKDLGAWWKVYGRDLAPILAQKESLSTWDRRHQQCLLQILVPLLILARVASSGWDIQVSWSAVYGLEPPFAPMVSWIIAFEFDRDKAAAPQTQRNTCLDGLLECVGRIDDATGAWKRLA
jgi:hypothetical protein